MADLKPLGSERLQGQEKLKRIMEIARFNESSPSNINETSKSEYKIVMADGNDYQIVKERQGYIIKKTISESETDYIEPMKNRKYYSSYSQAFKRLNLLAKEINRLVENEEGVALFGEQKKFVLKTPKPVEDAPAAEAPEAPPAVPSPELPPSPVAEPTGGEEAPMADLPPADSEPMDMGAEMPAGEEMEKDEEEVTFKSIQKLTGKLTQKVRALEAKDGMTSEDIKYVINMVLSSLDLGSLSDEDKEDILSKFEDAEGREEGDELPDLGGEEEMTPEAEPLPDMTAPEGEEMGEMDFGMGAIMDGIFGESKVDKVISKYFELTKKEILERQEKNQKRLQERKGDIEKIMESVSEMSETDEQKEASQKFLEENINSSFVGKTNKNNLVFESKGKQTKISPEGLLV